jgi:hypothetical protein
MVSDFEAWTVSFRGSSPRGFSLLCMDVAQLYDHVSLCW